MKKMIIFILLLTLTIILIGAIFSFQGITGFSVLTKNQELNKYSYTKAICNETSCQDYEIECKGSRLISIKSITGAVIEIDENWQDPRPEKVRERMCE